MKTLNPELESQVDALAELCCAALARERRDIDAAAKPLIRALVSGGYARLSDCNLQVRLESRALEKCQEPVIHRRRELAGITGQMQSLFNDLVSWETQTPRKSDGTQPANISSATDS